MTITRVCTAITKASIPITRVRVCLTRVCMAIIRVCSSITRACIPIRGSTRIRITKFCEGQSPGSEYKSPAFVNLSARSLFSSFVSVCPSAGSEHQWPGPVFSTPNGQECQYLHETLGSVSVSPGFVCPSSWSVYPSSGSEYILPEQ